MGLAMGKWAAALLIFVATSWTAGLRAADSPEEVLKKNGLKPTGPLYVLETESDVKKKLGEVRLLSKQWNFARLQQVSIGTAKDHQALIQGLTGQVNQIKSEITAVNQQMSHLPRFRGRLANNYVQQDYAELASYRNELNLTLNQQNAQLAQVKSRPPDPKLKQKIDADVQSRHEEYLQAVRDLTQLVSSTKDKYAALARSAEVTKALADLDPTIKPRPKLGPSHEFHETLKLVERLGKDPTHPASEPKAKATSRPRRGAKSSRTGVTEDLPG
jgi:hypothetical protein